MAKKTNVDISSYVHDPKQTLARRAAHFLDWAAKNQPRVFFAYNIILKAIEGFETTPLLKSKAVEHLRKGTMSRTKAILLKEYGRELVSQRGVGVRASVDSGDALIEGVSIKGKRVERAVSTFNEAVSHIDPSEFPKTEEFKPWRQYWDHGVKETMKALGNSDFLKKLEPPKMVPLLPPKKG